MTGSQEVYIRNFWIKVGNLVSKKPDWSATAERSITGGGDIEDSSAGRSETFWGVLSRIGFVRCQCRFSHLCIRDADAQWAGERRCAQLRARSHLPTLKLDSAIRHRHFCLRASKGTPRAGGATMGRSEYWCDGWDDLIKIVWFVGKLPWENVSCYEPGPSAELFMFRPISNPNIEWNKRDYQQVNY